MELYTNFLPKKLFRKVYLPSTLLLRYVRAKIIAHAFFLLDQPDNYINIQEKLKIMKNLRTCIVNGELFSSDITDSGRIPFREGDIQNFSPNPHNVVWENFPFKHAAVSSHYCM